MGNGNEARTLEVVESSSALVAQQNAGIVRAAPGDVAEAFQQYKQIQSQLDKAMPDCIMSIQGKKFRKKSYWRAIGTAFNVQLEMRTEERVELEGDWGFSVTYRATAPNGRYVDGDGTCMASEKGRGQGTVHNVKAHAHTRAKNRAISDLVGFGEVSAEELPDASRKSRDIAGAITGELERQGRMPKQGSEPMTGGRRISEGQRKLVFGRTFGKADALGISHDDAMDKLREIVGGEVEEIAAAQLDTLLKAIEQWTTADFGDEQPPDDVKL